MSLRPYLKEEQLEEMLRQAFRRLNKQGLLQDANEDDLVQGVLNNLKKGGDRIPDFQFLNDGKSLADTLRVMLVCEHTNSKDPTKQFDYANFFKKLPELRLDGNQKLKEQLIKELEEYLREKLDQINNLSANPKNPAEIAKLAKNIAENLVENKDQLAQDKDTMKFFAALNIMTADRKPSEQELAYRNLHGGEDPRQSGGIQMIVEQIWGNALSLANMAPSGQYNDMSEMAADNRYDSDRADPLGEELTRLMDEIGFGAVVDTSEEEELVDPLQQFLEDKFVPSKSPQNKPI